MNRFSSILFLLAAGLCLFNCNLSDFNTDNLIDAVDLNPVLYRPFTSGTYLVKDYATVPGNGTAIVKNDSLAFNMINYDLNGMFLNTTGTDSMVVIIKSVNESPMRYRYWLSYADKILDSGSVPLKNGGVNAQGDVITSSSDSLEFKLNKADVVKLTAAQSFHLNISLYQPTTGNVTAAVLKNSVLSIRIGFRAPVNLFKVRL